MEDLLVAVQEGDLCVLPREEDLVRWRLLEWVLDLDLVLDWVCSLGVA